MKGCTSLNLERKRFNRFRTLLIERRLGSASKAVRAFIKGFNDDFEFYEYFRSRFLK